MKFAAAALRRQGGRLRPQFEKSQPAVVAVSLLAGETLPSRSAGLSIGIRQVWEALHFFGSTTREFRFETLPGQQPVLLFVLQSV